MDILKCACPTKRGILGNEQLKSPRMYKELRLGISFKSLSIEVHISFLRDVWTTAVLQGCWYMPIISKDLGSKCSLQCTNRSVSISCQTIWSGLCNLVSTKTSKPDILSFLPWSWPEWMAYQWGVCHSAVYDQWISFMMAMSILYCVNHYSNSWYRAELRAPPFQW